MKKYKTVKEKIEDGLLKYTVEDELNEFRSLFAEYLKKLDDYLQKRASMRFDFFGGAFSSHDVLTFECDSAFMWKHVSNVFAEYWWNCRGFTADVRVGIKTGSVMVFSYHITDISAKESIQELLKELKVKIEELE